MLTTICPRRSILLLIDLEPDDPKTHREDGGWNGSNQALAALEGLRSRLEDRTGARVQFNWFFRSDPQIQQTWGKAEWVGDACPAILKTIARHDDYCGIHPHLWRWDGRRSTWFNELSSADWTAECLHTAIEGFQRIFGRRPEACRFGYRYLSDPAVRLMKAAGIRYDLTLEPGLPDEPVTGDRLATRRLPDYRGASREPYRPSPANYLVPDPETDGTCDLWIIPLTTTVPRWRLVRRPPYVVKASRSPNLALGESCWPHLRTQLERETDVPLVIVFRSGDWSTPRFRRSFLRTTERLAACPALAGCEFTNPDAAIARWRHRE